MIAGSLTS